MLFTEYVNSVRQSEAASIQQVISSAAQTAPVLPGDPLPMGVATMPAPYMPGYPMMPAVQSLPMAPAPPGFVLQPNFGMIPVPPEAMASNCGKEIAEDAVSALVTLTFRPKKLSDDDKELFEKYIQEKAKKDLELKPEEVAADVKIREEQEAEFWKTACNKNFGIYFSRINCKVVEEHEYEPEVKPDGSGVRVYQVEITKTDGTPIKESLSEKSLTELNDFIRIVPAIRKEKDLPEVIFQPSIRLADCQAEKHLKARWLTEEATKAQKTLLQAMQEVDTLTRPAVEAQSELPAKENALKSAEVTLASWNKYIEMTKDTQPESETTKAKEQQSAAVAAKAKAEDEVKTAQEKTKEALSKLKEAKQKVVAAEFDVQNAVESADKVRKEVPATCELFNIGATCFCPNGCGYSGTKPDVDEHYAACDIEYSCDAPDCPFKGNFKEVQDHEATCEKVKAMNTGFGFGALALQPQIPYFQPAPAPMMMPAPVYGFPAYQQPMVTSVPFQGMP